MGGEGRNRTFQTPGPTPSNSFSPRREIPFGSFPRETGGRARLTWPFPRYLRVIRCVTRYHEALSWSWPGSECGVGPFSQRNGSGPPDTGCWGPFAGAEVRILPTPGVYLVRFV